MMAVTTHATTFHERRGVITFRSASPASPKLTPQLHEFSKGANDHRRIATGWLTRFARVVMNTHLGDRRPDFSCACEHLHIDKRTGAPKLREQPLDQVAAVDLEAAIDVAHGNLEEQP